MFGWVLNTPLIVPSPLPHLYMKWGGTEPAFSKTNIDGKNGHRKFNN